MRYVILDYYVNEFGTNLFISQRILHGVIQIQEEKYSDSTTYCIAHRKYKVLVKTKEKAKSKNVVPRKKVALELLHNRLGHISTR